MATKIADKTFSSPSLSVFRDRNFLLLWLAQIISSLGDWALFVVIPVTVYNATSSKTALGLSMISGTLPVLFFGLAGGVFADRWNRRRTMVVVGSGTRLRHPAAAGHFQ